MGSRCRPMNSGKVVRLLLGIAAVEAACGCRSQEPAEVRSDSADSSPWPGCAHPEVKADCNDGWCRIPPGCFILGSPETEFGRGKYSEQQVPVTLTHAFLIQQYEVSRSEWTAIDPEDPSFDTDEVVNCLEPDCPVTGVSWFKALDYANKASLKHDPPLKPCYELSGCGMPDAGNPTFGWQCSGVKATSPTIYQCEGFRLPTEAEWEYAARAGTVTAFYSGDITPYEMGPDTDYCKQPEPKLDEIAWTCLNTGVSYPRQLRPRGLKKPNGWGLHDIIGNAFEWVNDDFNGLSHGIAPLADPFGIPLPTGMSQARGGAVNTWSGMCRAAFHFQGPKNAKGPISGLRLVRTIK